MLRTVSRSYATLDAAKHVVADLEGSGFRPDQISLIGRPAAGDDVAGGAMLGGTAGAATGLLAGLGTITVPGLGPLVSAGWLASTIVAGSAGALAGSIAGALAAQFVSPEEANSHAGLLQRGGSLVSVHGEDEDIERAQDIMDRGEPIDPASVSDFGRQYWSGSSQSGP